jgi:hypothetical protein
MQDRVRDEMMAELDAEILKEIEDELRTGQMGEGAQAQDQARADQEGTIAAHR